MKDMVREYITAQVGQTVPKQSVQDVLDGILPFEAWRLSAQETLSALLGNPPESCLLDFSVDQEEEFEGVVLQRVSFNSEPGLRTPALILKKSDADEKSPGVVLLHGHQESMFDVIGVDASFKKAGETHYSRLCMELARSGYVVTAPELLGFGELRTAQRAEEGLDACDIIAPKLNMIGRSLLGVRVHQARRAITALSKFCDGQRLGMAGFSGGGAVTAIASALDRRVKAAAVLGYLNLLSKSVLRDDHCACNDVSGFYESFDIPDVLAMIMPRPLLVGFGKNDEADRLEGEREAAALLQRAAKMLRCPLIVDEFGGGHEVNQESVIRFLKDRL